MPDRSRRDCDATPRFWPWASFWSHKIVCSRSPCDWRREIYMNKIMTKHKLLSTAIFVACTALSPSSLSACQTDDIKILQADWHRTSEKYVKIVGEFRNGCAEPTGVQLAFTFRDSAEKVVAVDEPWPASILNVPPKTTYPFELLIEVGPSATSMTARVLQVKQ